MSLAMLPKKIAIFWHKGDLWLYGVFLAPRRDIPKPPNGLGIQYDHMYIIAFEAMAPFSKHIFKPDQL